MGSAPTFGTHRLLRNFPQGAGRGGRCECMASGLGSRDERASFRARTTPAESDANTERLERALDTLGQVLTAFGEYAFDTDKSPADETRTAFTELARTLLLGVRREGDPDGASGRRDWGR